MNIGIFAMDPGGSTGLGWGIFDPLDKEGVGGALRNKMNSGSATVTGSEREQIREIAKLWQSFYSACVRSACLPPDHVWFVCEDYIYTATNTYGGDSAKISTALIWGVEGYRMGAADEFKAHNRRAKVERPPLILQTASQASSFATNARLKDWDVWVVGREHERSAWKHIALFLSHYIMQHVG